MFSKLKFERKKKCKNQTRYLRNRTDTSSLVKSRRGTSTMKLLAVRPPTPVSLARPGVYLFITGDLAVSSEQLL